MALTYLSALKKQLDPNAVAGTDTGADPTADPMQPKDGQSFLPGAPSDGNPGMAAPGDLAAPVPLGNPGAPAPDTGTLPSTALPLGDPSQPAPGQATFPNTALPLGDPSQPAPGQGTLPGGALPLGDPSQPPPPTGTLPNGPLPLGNPGAPAPSTGTISGDPRLTPPPGSADPFASSGGGTYINGQWIPNNNPGAIAAAKAALGPQAPAGATGTPGAGGTGTPDSNAPPTDVNDAYKQALMKLLTAQAPTDVNSDPVLAGQSQAFAVQQQRSKERAREALAQRSAATGQSSDLAGSGALDQGIVGLEQAQGEAQGANDAGLLQTAAQQQRDSLIKAATLASGDMNAEQSRALQDKLAELDAKIREEGLQQQGALGQQDLTLRDKLGSGQLNLGLLSALFGNSQFGQDLAAKLGMYNQTEGDSNFWKTLGIGG